MEIDFKNNRQGLTRKLNFPWKALTNFDNFWLKFENFKKKLKIKYFSYELSN